MSRIHFANPYAANRYVLEVHDEQGFYRGPVNQIEVDADTEAQAEAIARANDFTVRSISQLPA